METFTWGSLPDNLDLPPQEPSLYLDTFTWEPSLGDLCLATFAQTVQPCRKQYPAILGTLGTLIWEPLLGDPARRNLGGFMWQAGTFTWEPLLGTPYLGTLWDTSPRRPLLYLGTFTCKPANLRKLAGTCQLLLWNLYLEKFVLGWEP